MNNTSCKTIIPNKFLEINFILFPIWICFLYFFLKIILPLSDELIFFIFLFILGETHFASTYLFYLDKSNHEWIKKHFLKMIVIPTILAIIYIMIGVKEFYMALLLGAVFSGIHVTRQSIGIQRLYSQKRNLYFELNTYFFSFLFILIGFSRFYYNNLISSMAVEEKLMATKLFFNTLGYNLSAFSGQYTKIYLTLLLLGLSIACLEKTNYKKILTNITGVLIYAPYMFVNNIYDAIIIGVGAHWCQYVAINYKIYFSSKKNLNDKIVLLFLIFVIVYALMMSLLGYKTQFTKNFENLLLLVPLTGQFLHYYIDAFIWKFSDQHIREQIGSKLFSHN